METNETLLAMATRHVAEGERHIASQIEIIERLREKSLPSDEAENLLLAFMATQAEHKSHLQKIEDEIAERLRDAGGNLIFR